MINLYFCLLGILTRDVIKCQKHSNLFCMFIEILILLWSVRDYCIIQSCQKESPPFSELDLRATHKLYLNVVGRTCTDIRVN